MYIPTKNYWQFVVRNPNSRAHPRAAYFDKMEDLDKIRELIWIEVFHRRVIIAKWKRFVAN